MSNLQIWDFSKGLNNEFETAMVKEPSVFEPLTFYCIYSVTQMGFRRKSNKFCESASHTSKAILEMMDERKIVQTTRTYCKHNRPLPCFNPN